MYETGPSPVNLINKFEPTNFNKINNVICIRFNKKVDKAPVQNIIIVTF